MINEKDINELNKKQKIESMKTYKSKLAVQTVTTKVTMNYVLRKCFH